MKHFQIKTFLFHSFAYLLININYFIGIKVTDKLLERTVIRSGDGNMGLFLALIILFIQLFLGLIFSVIFSFEKQGVTIDRILTYILVNSLILLFFIVCNVIGGSYKEFTSIILGVFIIGNIVYACLLKKMNRF